MNFSLLKMKLEIHRIYWASAVVANREIPR